MVLTTYSYLPSDFVLTFKYMGAYCAEDTFEQDPVVVPGALTVGSL